MQWMKSFNLLHLDINSVYYTTSLLDKASLGSNIFDEELYINNGRKLLLFNLNIKNNI